MAFDVRGKTVVLTGTFAKLKRAEAEKQLAARGAKIGGSVGKSTHVLFAGEKAGSKINSATALGVTVLGEDDLMAVLRGDTDAAPAASPFAGIDPALPGAALAEAIAALPWDAFEADRDLPGLRAALVAHEARHGITAAHRAATAEIRELAVLQHAHGHDVEVEWTDLSPDGRWLATGSWTGDDYELGGVLQIWDVRAGRCVNMLRIRGGVGWPDYGPCVQWRPDGRRVGLTFDTNGVGSFDPFGRSGEPDSCAYVTDGWSRPPAWAWSPNSRDVYIACWGPKLALGAVVPLVGRNPQPRWLAQLGEPKDGEEPRLQPMKQVWWRHPDRVVGVSGWDQIFALDTRTGALLWDTRAAAPVTVSPDGAEIAMHPAGLVYYDAATGLPNGKLPMHVGAESFVWSRDGKRMAAVVQPGNKWQADPGVFVYDGGAYRYSPGAPAPRTNGEYAVAWSPDGGKLAVTSSGRLQIWELGEAPVLKLDVAAPGSGVMYGDGVLVAWGGFGLTFVREADGAVIGAFTPAIESSGDSPLASGGDDYGAGMRWNPAFPIDGERVAAALPEGVVIGPDEGAASVEEVDGKIAWVVERKWAWPWRWGEAKVWPDAPAACADKAAPAAFKRRFARLKAAAKPKKSTTWPPPGGSLDAIAGLLADCVKTIGDSYHGGDYRRKLAVRTMALGMFDRAATAIDGGPGWKEWDAWWSAYARGEVVTTALAGRVDGAPALTPEQTATLRRWLTEGEAALKQAGKSHAPCRPQAMLGAGWILLGEAKRGDKLLAAAVKNIEPEHNATEHRAVVAAAFAALGRVREASEHLTGGLGVSWAHSYPALAAIARRASAAELVHLHARMQAKSAHNEFVLLDRGLARLIALKEWDAAWAWLGMFEGLSTRDAERRLVAAMIAAGAEESARGRLLDLKDPRCAQTVRDLARRDPARAREDFDRVAAQADKLLASARYQELDLLQALAGAAARLGRLDAAARLEATARSADEKRAVQLGVLADLDPADPAWPQWFARVRTGASAEQKAEVAALAWRGKLAEAPALLDEAIAAARTGSYPDINLERVSGVLAQAGDLTGAHRVWQAIAKGKRSYRNGPLIDACVAAEAWAGALEILQAMPRDLNGAPQKASQILLKLGGGEGW